MQRPKGGPCACVIGLTRLLALRPTALDRIVESGARRSVCAALSRPTSSRSSSARKSGGLGDRSAELDHGVLDPPVPAPFRPTSPKLFARIAHGIARR